MSLPALRKIEDNIYLSKGGLAKAIKTPIRTINEDTSQHGILKVIVGVEDVDKIEESCLSDLMELAPYLATIKKDQENNSLVMTFKSSITSCVITG